MAPGVVVPVRVTTAFAVVLPAAAHRRAWRQSEACHRRALRSADVIVTSNDVWMPNAIGRDQMQHIAPVRQRAAIQRGQLRRRNGERAARNRAGDVGEARRRGRLETGTQRDQRVWPPRPCLTRSDPRLSHWSRCRRRM